MFTTRAPGTGGISSEWFSGGGDDHILTSTYCCVEVDIDWKRSFDLS